jgi:hypothetical protein
LVIALAEGHVEFDVEPAVNSLKRLEALGQELVPEFEVLGIAGVEAGRFTARFDRHVRMFVGQLA